MKKYLRISIILLSLAGSVLFFTNFQSNSYSHIENDYECQYGQCNAIAKSTGNRCKHCVSNPGDLYCWQHK